MDFCIFLLQPFWKVLQEASSRGRSVLGINVLCNSAVVVTIVRFNGDNGLYFANKKLFMEK
jgi:hypothetical protein